MDAVERFRRGGEIFERARHIRDPELRARYLDEACADAALREEVEALLRHDGEGLGDLGGAVREWLSGGEPSAVGGYRILRRVAEGGMATVYEAEQERPRRRVALKVLKPVLGAEARRRFELEADVLARLHHPCIAHVYAAGAEEARPFIAMEFVEGEPITAAAARLEPRRRVELLARVCDAMAHAHYSGVIHRDLKPSNILVLADGTPKVLDFGIARTAEATSLHTTEGSVLGTLGYMSPEQAAGDSRLVDVRSDVYSLGVVGYEMLAGRPPHRLEGKTFAAALRTLIEEEPPPLGAVDATWRGDVSAVIGKAMAPERERRYTSAAAMAEDLRRYLRDETVTARPPAALRQARRFLRRHKTFAAAAAALALALATWLVSALNAARRESALRATADRRAEQAERATQRFRIAAASAALREYDAPGAMRLLAAAESGIRGWPWRYLAAECDRSASFLPIRAEVFAFSAHGEFAYFDGERIAVVDAATGETRSQAAAHDVTALAFGGGRIFFGCADGSVRVAGGGELAKLPARVSHLAATPDGARVAASWGVWGRPPRTLVLDGITGAVLADVQSGHVLQRPPVFSPDGSRLAVPRIDYAVEVFDVDSGRVAYVLRGHENEVTVAAWRADGKRLATASRDRTVRVWEDGREVLRLEGHAGFPQALAYGPDGMLASGATDATIRVWSEAGECTAVLLGHQDEVTGLSWNESRVVSCAADGLRTWEPALHESLGVLSAHTSYAYAAAFGAGGSRLATVGWDRMLRVWDVVTGRELACVAGGGELYDVAVIGDTAIAVGKWGAPVGVDLRTGRAVELPEIRGRRAVAVAPDGTLAAFGDIVYDAKTLRPLRTLGVAVEQTAFSPDGRLLATTTEAGGCLLWDVASGERVWSAGSDGYYDVAFHRSGALFAGDVNGDVHRFEPGPWRETARFPAHRGRVLALAASPDGAWIVTGGDDDAIRFWDAATHERVLDLVGHSGYVHGLAFHGERLASASGDGDVRLWTTEPWRERLRRAEEALAR